MIASINIDYAGFSGIASGRVLQSVIRCTCRWNWYIPLTFIKEAIGNHFREYLRGDANVSSINRSAAIPPYRWQMQSISFMKIRLK